VVFLHLRFTACDSLFRELGPPCLSQELTGVGEAVKGAYVFRCLLHRKVRDHSKIVNIRAGWSIDEGMIKALSWVGDLEQQRATSRVGWGESMSSLVWCLRSCGLLFFRREGGQRHLFAKYFIALIILIFLINLTFQERGRTADPVKQVSKVSRALTN